jgi:hypothetical protein
LHDSPGDRRYHLGPDHILRFSRFAFSRTRLRGLTACGDHRRLYDSKDAYLWTNPHYTAL